MPEPIEPTPTDDAAELALLRKVNAEVVAKRQRDMTRIAEMEVAAIGLQTKVTEAEARVTEATVGVPLRRLAADLSSTPNLWLETFSKSFTVVSKDGELTIQTLAGEPLTNAKGQPVKFDPIELARYLTETDMESERTKVFRAITYISRATGGAVASRSDRKVKPTVPHVFGLR